MNSVNTTPNINIEEDTNELSINMTASTLPILGKQTVTDIVNAVKSVPVMKQEDYNFLIEKSEHLGMVMEKTWMWRTDFQKRSIINDLNHPTLHSKFHQAILEQKVQFDQTLYLAKDFEEKKLEVEELECDLEELEQNTEISEKRKNIKARKIKMDLQFAQYQLNNMKIAMNYRMSEVKGWQEIEEELLDAMRNSGYTEDEIWQKDYGEIQELFFRSMNNLQGIQKTTDGGEYNNLISVAAYAYQQAKDANLLDTFKQNPLYTNVVKNSVEFIEGYLSKIRK